MGKIIYCSDLVLRLDKDEEINNISDWILVSTDYRPHDIDNCVLRDEMSTHEKVTVILMVWTAMVVVTFIYCYFCEQRLFPAQKLFEQQENDGTVSTASCPNQECQEIRYKRF